MQNVKLLWSMTCDYCGASGNELIVSEQSVRTMQIQSGKKPKIRTEKKDEWKWPESKHVKQHTGTVLKENHCQRALQIS